MNDYMLVDLSWDRRKIKYPTGKIQNQIRGKDYDLDWLGLGKIFAKFNGKIFYFENFIFVKLMKIIDFDTFEYIASSKNNIHYFKDKFRVYYKYYNQELIIEGANQNTFKIWDADNSIATDGFNYYYFEKLIPFDLSKATILNSFYTISNNKIYFCFEEIENADYTSFEIIRENLCKDKNHLFFRKEIVIGVDVATFQILEGCNNGDYYKNWDFTFYAKDKFAAYFINTTQKAIKTIISKSLAEFKFVIIDEIGYAVDKEYRYYFGTRKKLGNL